MTNITMERVPMKLINISQKRQITIPKKLFEEFGFTEEAECIPQPDGILIRPKKNEQYDFSEEILKELISKGYEGEELLINFKKAKDNIRPAIINIIEEADKIAEDQGGYCTTKDLFD